jgi:hypothetical protein
MKEEIINNIENPDRLEQLYRLDPAGFSRSFTEAYDSIKLHPLAGFWQTRLKYELPGTVMDIPVSAENQPEAANKRFALVFTVIASLIAGTAARMPEILGFHNDTRMPADQYFLDNAAFFILPLLSIYYIIKNRLSTKTILIFSLVTAASIVFINLLPGDNKSDTHMLADMHLVLFMWVVLGVVFIGEDITSAEKQLQYIKRNGDVLILTAIILCGGMFLTGLTMGLFKVIQVRIEEFYFKYIPFYGGLAAPIVANYMIETSPTIINKVAPFISKIFTPLILIVMTCFLVALIFFAKDPFSSRDELIVFNVLLVLNLAIIVFSFSGQTAGVRSYYNKIILLLSFEAIIINCIAISAIIYRLAVFGVSPNRIVVLGANLLMS